MLEETYYFQEVQRQVYRGICWRGVGANLPAMNLPIISFDLLMPLVVVVVVVVVKQTHIHTHHGWALLAGGFL